MQDSFWERALDWFMCYIMLPFIVLGLIFMLGLCGYAVYAWRFQPPPPVYTLRRDDWQCTATRTVMVGKVFVRQCIRMERRP